MTTFAPPISRDGFVYHDTFYVDVGNLNRHPRASTAELSALLRPDLSSSSTAPPPPKDQVGHWYEAQLKHYGLPHTKDKNAAKVRLLNALNTGKLVVPAEIRQLEAKMKKDYAAENRKAKEEAKKSHKGGNVGAAAVVERGGAGRKRKKAEPEDEDVPSTAWTAKRLKGPPNGEPTERKAAKSRKNTTAYSSLVSEAQSPTVAKPSPLSKSEQQPGTSRSIPTARKSAPTPEARPFNHNNATAYGSLVSEAQSPAIARPTPTPKTERQPGASRSKQTARKSAPTPQAKPVSHEGSKQCVPAQKEPISQPQRGTKKAVSVKKDPSHEHSTKNKKVVSTEREPSTDSQWNNTITGIYSVSCQMEDSAMEVDCEILLYEEGNRVWCSFDWDSYSIILLMDPGPTPNDQTENRPISVGWRSRNHDTGGLRFGRGCHGEVTIFSDGQIEAKLYNLFGGTLEFWGARDRGISDGTVDAANFEEEWDSFLREAYG